ncbi:nuclear transport factor 2 family protein [Arthrobacter sp. H20]|uniref:nuclear transport factor 2 family protein n=1 Tax=Arthrobacter sp. H20 TaxID=1267981 RepID=UPI0004B0CCF4|nr:nuclear transport factor 2 family protein [Arthrobacter sp. H20]
MVVGIATAVTGLIIYLAATDSRRRRRVADNEKREAEEHNPTFRLAEEQRKAYRKYRTARAAATPRITLQRVSLYIANPALTDDLATLHALITYRKIGMYGAEQNSMQNRLTRILKCTGGAWKIVHEHTSAPLDFRTQKVILERY